MTIIIFVKKFQDEKAAAAKRPTLTGVSSSSSSTKPTTQGNLLKGIVNYCSIRWINRNQKLKLKTKIFFVGVNNLTTFLYTLNKGDKKTVF